ncbi:PAS domain-containing sensor histidine kinase [Variovorax guangxiensis]|uniref:histidine kinase n=1 Tax=Variovorax guangxiensis TaxID=1775474 RepID=A0A502E1I7_9BURK|nr:PAS domain-containing sensor histidine kinase [Variovorax guangxiensis]TPG26691.1 PAS domain-containing sensor histidine kinase [Variovorax ginsengisoli]TPG30416.1 PAS domain-containing sensor histidine kinase [Variovorax guangxiensis]
MKHVTDTPTAPYGDIFVGNGEMAELMRRHDWAATPLGPPEGWPEPLKVALRILLTSRFQMWLGWGPDVAFFYNDAYRPTLGLKHPQALAMPTQTLWAEIWDVVKDRIHTVYDKGESTWDASLMLLLERAGYKEETYHTFSYSPLLGDGGKVEGLFCAVSEDTARVISERRLESLRDLGAALSALDTRQSVLQAAGAALAHAARDLPFALIYLFEPTGEARLHCAIGIDRGHRLAPESLDAGAVVPWRLDRLAGGENSFVVPLADAPDVPAGPWDQPAPAAFVVSLPPQGAARSVGFMVCGANPYRPLTAEYTSFVQLLAGQIAPSLANADALEKRTAERDRLRGLFKQAPGFMCVLSGPKHVFELTNASYQQLIGHRDVEGKPLRDALPEMSQQGFLTLLDTVYETGKPFVGQGIQVMLQREPGAPLEERFLDFVYQPIFDASGAATGVFAEGSDVTEKVRAENALRALNNSLEARIAERTQEVEHALQQLRTESQEREAAEAALRQAQKMEAVGQLTGGLAHDFNNLLSGITGSLELMLRRLRQGRYDDFERYIHVGQGAAKRAAALTHRLLAFSRRQTLDPKPTDINRLVAGMEELVRRSIGPENQLEVVGAVGLWITRVDPHQLENALLNLCLNARDAMPHGGRLTIETANKWMDERAALERDLPVGQYVSLCVTDTGTGMPPEIVQRVFEPFFTTKPIGMGTGLGLSMVYGFARQSGGQVRVYSEVGMGTTMCVYLPRHYENEAVDTPPPATGPAPRPGFGTVLVVDDEPSVRTLVTEVLGDLGYRTLEAEEGATGLALLQSSVAIDLLITDVGLPGGMNGRQLADGARASRPGLKVLFITGYAENAVLGNGHLDPGMEIMTKPFTLDALALRVQQMVASKA